MALLPPRLAIVLVLAALISAPGLASADPSRAPGGGGLPPSTNVTYNSSVDGWPLSYLQWLPAEYNASASYPLAVFLHGIGTSTSWVRGGVGASTDVWPGLVKNASADHVILISLNTRTSAGFFANTACGGPQRQDVLDAIAHEEARVHVSALYLIGFSMGSVGAFTIAANNSANVSGIATVGTITDSFETVAYNTHETNLNPAWKTDLCLPATTGAGNATLDAFLLQESPFRFDPQAFAGIRVYVTVGMRDTRAPNNFSAWPFANGNSTFVNSSCSVSSLYGEPANCTTTYVGLHNKAPSLYLYRFVYELLGTHQASGLPSADVFRYLEGNEAGGIFHTTFPPTTLRAG